MDHILVLVLKQREVKTLACRQGPGIVK
jgi:hypothetical protein